VCSRQLNKKPSLVEFQRQFRAAELYGLNMLFLDLNLNLNLGLDLNLNLNLDLNTGG
jgi:hypothetical protein